MKRKPVALSAAEGADHAVLALQQRICNDPIDAVWGPKHSCSSLQLSMRVLCMWEYIPV